MELSERLKELRISKKYKQTTIAKILGVSQGAYQKWESGSRYPKVDEQKKIADLFDVSLSYLIGETNIKEYPKVVKMIDQLNDKRKEKAIHFVSKQFEEQQNENNIILFNSSLFGYPVLSDQALSAGKGNDISDDMSTYTVYWTKEVNCDYGVPIKGDSMEPDYHNKDIALIQEQPCPDYDGQVCAVLDFDRGVSYIKCVTVEDKFLRLESLNQEVDDDGNLLYEDILLPRDETIKVLGKVIESFTPVEKKEI